ncbi:hypothetical protein ACWGKQ_05390 [Streptomyces sp. NPDC054770]
MTAKIEGIRPPAPGEGGQNRLPVGGIRAPRVHQDERRSIRRPQRPNHRPRSAVRVLLGPLAR